MKKHLFLLIIITTFGFTKTNAQNTFNKEQIFEMLKKQAFVDTLKDEIAISAQIVPANTKLRFMHDTIASPNFDSWFFLIDYHPFADWEHPCKYVFANPIDNSFIEMDGYCHPSFPIRAMLRQKQKENWEWPSFEKKQEMQTIKQSK